MNLPLSRWHDWAVLTDPKQMIENDQLIMKFNVRVRMWHPYTWWVIARALVGFPIQHKSEEQLRKEYLEREDAYLQTILKRLGGK